MSLGKRSQGCALFFTPPESGRKFSKIWEEIFCRVESVFYACRMRIFPFCRKIFTGLVEKSLQKV